MPKYTIKHDVPDCIACAACTAISDNWEMIEKDGEEKAMPKKSTIEESELENNKEAAESCPVEIIHIFDEKGKKII